MKFVLRLSTGVGFLFLVALVSSLIINAFDEDLSPQVAMTVKNENDIPSTEGGKVLMGLFFDSPTWKEDAGEIIAGKRRLDSTIKYLSLPQSYDIVHERYQQLLNATDFQTPYKPVFTEMMKVSPWSTLVRTRHEKLSALGEAAQLEELLKEARLLRRLIDSKNALLFHLIYFSNLRENIDLVSALVQKNPQLKKKLTTQALAPYHGIDFLKVIEKIIPYEIAIGASAVDMIESNSNGSFSSTDWQRYWKFFLRPNETKNDIADDWNFVVANSCWVIPTPEVCSQHQEALMNTGPWQTWSNQGGRIFFRIFAVTASNRFTKLSQQIDYISLKAASL